MTPDPRDRIARAHAKPRRPTDPPVVEDLRRRLDAERQAVDGAVSGGPFDTGDLDLDSADPPPPLPRTGRVAHPPTCGACHGAGCPVVEYVDETLPGLDPEPSLQAVADRFAPAARPRIVDGLIVPAVSVAESTTATWVLVPVGEVAAIGQTARAVGITPKTGRWLPVWIGDNHDELVAVLNLFAADLGTARRLHR